MRIMFISLAFALACPALSLRVIPVGASAQLRTHPHRVLANLPMARRPAARAAPQNYLLRAQTNDVTSANQVSPLIRAIRLPWVAIIAVWRRCNEEMCTIGRPRLLLWLRALVPRKRPLSRLRNNECSEGIYKVNRHWCSLSRSTCARALFRACPSPRQAKRSLSLSLLSVPMCAGAPAGWHQAHGVGAYQGACGAMLHSGRHRDVLTRWWHLDGRFPASRCLNHIHVSATWYLYSAGSRR